MINKHIIIALFLIALQALPAYSKEGTVRGLQEGSCPVSGPSPGGECTLPPGEDSLTCDYDFVLTADSKANGKCSKTTYCIPTYSCSCEYGSWICLAVGMTWCESPNKNVNIGGPCTP